MSSVTHRLSYHPDKFVNREPELDLVRDLVDRLLDGELLERRAAVFFGQRGAGKSWLLQEIGHRLNAKARVLPLYIDLISGSNRISKHLAALPPEEAVASIIERIHQSVAQVAGPDAVGFQSNTDLDQLTEQLVGDLHHVQDVIVLLFDHVDESDDAFLGVLEDRLLSSLANFSQLLLVLAGRGKEYTWKTPTLRLKNIEWDLGPFRALHIQQQIAKQVPKPARPVAEIGDLGGGYPWTNYLLAVDSSKRVDALEHCVEILFGDWLKRVDPPVNRKYFEALCVLRAFSDEMIPPMLCARFDEPAYLEWPYRQYRRVRQELIQTTLIKWDTPCGGYVMDGALKYMLEHWLYEKHPEVWQRLHEAARDMFSEWVVDYPRTANRWRKERDYHQQQLDTLA